MEVKVSWTLVWNTQLVAKVIVRQMKNDITIIQRGVSYGLRKQKLVDCSCVIRQIARERPCRYWDFWQQGLADCSKMLFAAPKIDREGRKRQGARKSWKIQVLRMIIIKYLNFVNHFALYTCMKRVLKNYDSNLDMNIIKHKANEHGYNTHMSETSLGLAVLVLDLRTF